ncbi:MAG: L-rhamnose isomerase, partial [Eubacteriales bacterium]|nr:L-rhamnose isomerase [Eubacteriales bacterium]
AAAVWNKFCAAKGAPVGIEWLESVREYEKNVLSER